ncbi:hypothetical protein U1Q18_008242 [Sarracenia purpurea var. burkii]
MAHKHLHELLKEDQEPFLLKNYIADRRSQIKRPEPKPSLQVKKRKPVFEISDSKRILCNQACFFPFIDSPDVGKSPFLDFPSPASAKSPTKTSNAVVLHVPSRTAALLLDAAMRIQKQSSSSRPQTQAKNARFGLFGPIIKRLMTSKNRTRDCEIVGGGGDGDLPRKSAGMCEKVKENVVGEDDKSGSEMIPFPCSCNNSRRNSTVWSESNEEKSMDLGSCSSSRSDESEEIDEFTAEEERENGAFSFREDRFCSSPFRFALQNSPSPGRRTPVFSSPATSPIRHNEQEKEKCEAQSTQKTHLVEEEEEKEQCSPVSVLDPPFQDDDGGNENGDDGDIYDPECSYATVQRAKQQLLHKLRRFEKLADLDPIELERRMVEEQDDEDQLEEEEEEEEECEEEAGSSLSWYREKKVDGLVREIVLGKSLGFHLGKVPADMKRLVLDLVVEEREKNGGGAEDNIETVVTRVCKSLDSWKEVESNTIDMMVELDFRREVDDGWKRNGKEVGETAREIEIAILGFLVQDVSEELLVGSVHKVFKFF